MSSSISTLMALCEKADNDIRACLNTLQVPNLCAFISSNTTKHNCTSVLVCIPVAPELVLIIHVRTYVHSYVTVHIERYVRTYVLERYVYTYVLALMALEVFCYSCRE